MERDHHLGAYAAVLVGYDGSVGSERALRWAAEDARLRRLPLTVVHAWPVGADETVRDAAGRILERGVRIAREASPRTRTRGRLVAGPAAEALVEEAEDASLAVVGAGLADPSADPSADSAADSAAVRLPAYARCPVVVVRGVADRGRPIIVGVDGSAASDAALAFGFEEAALRGQPLRAVLGCWEPAAIASAEMGMITDPDQLRAAAADRLNRVFCPWRERYPNVDAGAAPALLTPRHALMAAAARAGMLVLGDRGGVAGSRPGAVSGDLLRHAPCTVAIVRLGARDRA